MAMFHWTHSRPMFQSSLLKNSRLRPAASCCPEPEVFHVVYVTNKFANVTYVTYVTYPKNLTWSKLTYLGLSENVVYPIVPNGFADHYPY